MTKSQMSYDSVSTMASTELPSIQEANRRDRPVLGPTRENANPYETAADYGIPLLNGSREPMQIPFCPHCSAEQVRTRTKTYPNLVTWASVVVTATICFPLFWVPLVVDPCKRTDHYCSNCGRKIGSIQPLEGFCEKERI